MKDKKENAVREWTKSETAKLIELYPNFPTSDVSKQIGRTIASVAYKATILGLRKNYDTRFEGRDLKQISDEKVEQIKTLYPNTSNTKICKLLRCHSKTVFRVAKQFGLEKSVDIKSHNPDGLQKWTEEEIEILKAMAATHSDLEISQKLNRSEVSIGRRRRQLGKDFQRYGYQQQKHVLSESQIAEFRQMYPATSNEKLGKYFNFSPTTVRRIALELNLKKDDNFNVWKQRTAKKGWTAEEANLLVELLPTHTIEEIAEKIGRSVYSVRNKRQHLFSGDEGKLNHTKREFWTPEKLAKLKSLYGSTETEAIAEIFDCSIVTVYYQARKQGLKREPDFYSRIDKTKPVKRVIPISKPHNGVSRARQWNPEQIEKFKELYPNTSNRKITEVLGFKEGTISYLKKLFGLYKTPEYIAHSHRNRRSNIGLSFHENLYIQLCYLNGLDRNQTQLNYNAGKKQISIKPNGADDFVPFKNYLWEINFGEIPVDRSVVLKDGNHLNCQISNLICIPSSDVVRHYKIVSYPEELQSTVSALFDLRKLIRETPKKSNRYSVPKTHKIWSDAEIDFLNKNYQQLNNAQLSIHLKRDPQAVARKKSSLGLVTCANRGGRRNKKNQIWTPERIKRLKERYPNALAKELAQEFGCSAPSITTKAKELGMSRGRGKRPTSRLKANMQAQISL